MDAFFKTRGGRREGGRTGGEFNIPDEILAEEAAGYLLKSPVGGHIQSAGAGGRGWGVERWGGRGCPRGKDRDVRALTEAKK